MWLRCGIDEWHLDCQAGGELDLSRSASKSKEHDFIAAVRRKEDNRFEFFVSPSYTRMFDSNETLSEYLRALGMEEIGTVIPHMNAHWR